MKAISYIDNGTYSVFQLGHHWPQCDANEWFHEAVTAGTFEPTNMGNHHNPDEPPTLVIRTQDNLITVYRNDWVLRAPDGEIFSLSDESFSIMFNLESE